MTKVCNVDFETRGTVELKRTGVYPYAAHHDTGIWCMAYAFDDEPEINLWIEGQPFPERLREHIAAGGEMRAWNAQFERVMWRDCAIRRYDFPPVADEQWFCTMADAAAMALPRALEKAADVLQVEQQKDMSGNRLSKQMARPRRFTAEGGEPIWWDDEARLAKLYPYCQQDVRSERAVMGKVRRLNARERALYLLDQAMNDHGVPLDRKLILAAKKIAERETLAQNKLLAEATGGEVMAVTQVAKLKTWLERQGITTETLAAKAVAEMLDSTTTTLSDEVRQALDARAQAAKSSVAKLNSMLNVIGHDDFARGLMLYHGASTGRWAGKLVQPHNFPRGLDVENVESYIPTVLAGDPKHEVTMTIIAAMLRSMIRAPKGQQLMAVDFSAIEARVLAWLAGDHEMLRQFRENRKIYLEMGEVIYGHPIVKPSPEYQIAKNTVLGCGFGMGAKTFKKQAKAQGGVDVPELIAKRAVDAYRQTYPAVPKFWDDTNAAAIEAVQNPGTVVEVGRIKFTKRGGYLWIVLPAGRALAYAAPKIIQRPVPWDANDIRPAVEFSGVDSYTHQWKRHALYGGLIVENIVQAVARDLLADAMLRTAARGINVILSVHDEIVSLSDQPGAYDVVFEEMTRVPSWAEGCPITAEGWAGERYRK